MLVHRQQLLLSAGLVLLLICLESVQARPHTPTNSRYQRFQDAAFL
jgi:hypothetical protein